MYTIEEINAENRLLNSVLIKNDKLNFRSSIYPNLGASLQQLKSNGIEIIDGISNDEKGLKLYKSKFNSAFLFPSPNRIADGKYNFNGVDYQLKCNEAGLNNSLHGHIYNKSFQTSKIETSESQASVTFSYSNNRTVQGFPFQYQLDITYTFSKNALRLDFKVINTGKQEFPFGIGWHPYFNAKNLTSSNLNFNGDKKYFLNNQMIPQQEIQLPFKTPLTLEDTFLDDCFLIKKPEATFKCDAYKIEIDFTSETEKSYLQVYTPDTRDCIAIEPMTCAPNSFNNKNGLLTLKPTKTYDWQINIKF
tara:strand:+ start:5773 stop:6687 length:915 start_codon:yes stop_codon:yes gene_type:complete